MNAYTYTGTSEYNTGSKLIRPIYSGLDCEQCEGTIEDVIAYLEGLKDEWAVTREEPLNWEGRYGWFYTGSDALDYLNAEIASLRDGTHSSLQPKE